MSTDENGGPPADGGAGSSAGSDRIRHMDIQEEMRASYLTYAMSVIISRALPDVRDGLKPAQRRILVAMHDLNLGPGSQRVKCAKISGDTSGNYHPHGEQVIYPTLVRMAQPWNMRSTLVDPQGNFGSLAGLPPAAMRYTEARMSAVAAEMLEDIRRDTVDFVPSYDQRNMEPVVLPAKFPNLLVNGSSGIAVGMATSIPPHNLGEVCGALILLIDNPEATLDEIIERLPGPDFPTGGIICGRYGIRQAYKHGRSTIVLRARTHFETEKKRDVIVITEIPYMETRDRIREKLEELVRQDKVKGINRIIDLTDRNVPPWQVRLHVELKADADKDVVLAQLFRYSPLQSTVSVILLALVGNRPELLPIKNMLQEFLRHRLDVIRRRTEFLLAEARRRKHIVEGLLIAQLNIDEIIQTIRRSPSRQEARNRLQQIAVPAEMVARALGDDGFREYQTEQGVRETYFLSTRQAEAIVSMQLGSLANLERDQLGNEHRGLLDNIAEYIRLLSSEANMLAVIRADLEELARKYGDPRRTEISDDELTSVNRDELITEETMVVTLSTRGYIKRTPLSVYQAQNRGGKGIKGAKSDEEDPIEHLFVASTHAYLLFFTDRGKVYWLKVYDIPLQARTAKGRALINLLSLEEGERVYSCIGVREFSDDHYLLMATRQGTVKKTVLSAYSRPLKGGLIAISLDEGDELIDVRIVTGDDDVVLATANGMSIRFSHEDARSMGRNTRGVRGIKLKTDDDHVVGMVVADPDKYLLTICENGYGKRTPFGPGGAAGEEESEEETAAENAVETETPEENGEEAATAVRSTMQYRRQGRGGSGVRDIRATARNGKVIDILSVSEDDELLMVSAGGKIQRIRVADISIIGRNTQGVRIMSLDEGDKIVSSATISSEEIEEGEELAALQAASPSPQPTSAHGDQEPHEDASEETEAFGQDDGDADE